ncbi:type II toxin-antitoxin system VapC family toxin [Salipiger sp. PrR003]|uniref:type II toxin-antitoxin system VapC family toxin n=1 Tax=Salipiger sp. PrR003 TaxID=2706776 RepID=UPI0013DBA87B|nr:type II toxin-antitoxin system VapC family toxin [Salipiger sp. PrR003]NDV52956.1 type II toxin-antitoxin system VapC family toxin [Salipiger sp. PrR003]
MIQILDTNIISQARRPDRAPQIAKWLASQDEKTLYLSTITLGEIERGVVLQEARNPDFANDLRVWLDRTVRIFSDRILDFSADDALHWGRLSARIGNSSADLMIAAQALSRDGLVITRNVSDFAPTGVKVVDPTL